MNRVNKTTHYAAMAEEAIHEVVQNQDTWKNFLRTAASFYKYPFLEQVMIHKQRPNATACADYNFWNNRWNRSIRAGSKGIGLVSYENNTPKLRYVFDVADTREREYSRPVQIWSMKPEHERPIQAELAKLYDVSPDKLEMQFEQIAQKLASDYWEIHSSDIKSIVPDSLLEEYDNENLKIQFQQAVSVSVTYTLMIRCGINTDTYFESRDFSPVFNFNTSGAIKTLGTAVGNISERVLRQIENGVKRYQRDISRNEQKTENQIPFEVSRPEDKRLQSPSKADYSIGIDSQLGFTEAESVMDTSSAFLISQSDINQFLRWGGNTNHHRECIISAFEKQKSVKEIADYLQILYHGGNGLITEHGNISAWYAEDGIHLAHGNSARYELSAQVVSWEDAAKRIAELLHAGEFATHAELASAADYERTQVAEKIWYLYHDLSDEGKEAGYLQILTNIRTRAFPAETRELAKQLENPLFRDRLAIEYQQFLSAYQENRGILRFHYHKTAQIAENITDLNLPRRQFTTNMETLPKVQKFITEDEINDALSHGGDVWGSNSRIYTFLSENHTIQEQEEFLKNEYGTGGHSHALSGAAGSDEWHDSKGIVYKKSDCPDVHLTWKMATKRITDLIHQKRYSITEKQAGDITTPQDQPTSSLNENLVSIPVDNETVPPIAEAQKATDEEYKANIRRNAENFHIVDTNLGEGGAKAKFQANLHAIKLLKELESSDRQAIPEQQEVLAKYVGWGGLSDAFDSDKPAWSKEYQDLKEVLTPAEYDAARASTLNAHYTSPTVIKAIYKAVGNMGFETGKILEPSCGVGNFFGMLPEEMQSSRLYGVEIDSISGRIAKQLYPKANITVAGFESTNRNDFFDLAIGNVPFGNYKVADKPYDKLGFSIHNYFFAKTIDQVRPGGIIAFVTSRFTMDSKNADARTYIAQRAELLGAVRLPNNAFKKNAGAEVVSDIIFLQKREQLLDSIPEWVHLSTTPDGYTMNSYFVEHPEMILGALATESTQYGKDELTVRPLENTELAEQLEGAIANIRGYYQEIDFQEEVKEAQEQVVAPPEVKNYSYAVIDGEIYYRENNEMILQEVNPTTKARIKGMIELRDCVRTLITYQLEDYPENEIQTTQQRLNQLYDSFVSQYGRISSRTNNTAFREDNSYYLLTSLEITDNERNFIRKADMFSKRTIKQKRTVTSVDTASEALIISVSEKAKIDIPYMMSLTGKDEKTLVSDLHGVIFQIPSSQEGNAVYVTADEYLSGNVRQKLREAKEAAQTEPIYQVNVSALEAVQPVNLKASEISVRLGATWIPPKDIRDFMFELFDTPGYMRWNIKVHYSKATGTWNIEGKSNDKSGVKSRSTYGTPRINGYKIMEDTLNLKDVRIFDYVEDPDGRRVAVLNKQETAIAQAKQELIKQAFADWIWNEPERRERLCTQYNEQYNAVRARQYDGSHLNFVGMNPEIELRPHQVNAIAHIIYGGNTLLAHVVGAGKTFEMVAAAQESKRLGLCHKSMIAVPNHLTEQWASEYLQLYPSANILVVTKKDFEPKNRKKFCARIASSDVDAVIIGHSQLEKIPMSIERQKAILEEQMQEVLDGIAELKANDGERFSIKQMERTRKALETKLKQLNDQSRKDDVVTFEELGVDRLFVDEAHSFKNLAAYTKMRNVSGISQTEAQKSSDLYMKCRYLDELTGGRGVIFATGTPISNSMVELYTMQKYLQHDLLKEKELLHFDAWASTFGETVTAMELAPEGTGYRAKTRFARFYNLPELMTMFREVADIQTADMLNLPVPKANYHNILLPASEHQKEIVESFAERAESVRNKQVDSSEDNMLLITNDGRKLALDQRLLNPMLPDSENNKVSACAAQVFDIWQRTAEQKSTQMVFCDLSTPKNDGEFNVYDDLRDKLIAKGIPEKNIAYIHDANTEAQKKELFGKVNDGEVRILIGSTQKMGAGTNCQKRLIALHHLDCPWRPSDLQQREGRIIRQGNDNNEIDIYTYLTENTFDSYLYQLVESKQKFIGQIMTSKSPVRSAEDVDEAALSYGEIKALCTGNPHIKERMELEADVSRLKLLKSNYLNQKYGMEDRITKIYPQNIAALEQRCTGYESDIAMVNQYKNVDFSILINGTIYEDKKTAGAAILDACKKTKSHDALPLGEYHGFSLTVSFDAMNQEFVLTAKNALKHTVRLGTDPLGNIQRIDNAISSSSLIVRLEGCKTQLEETKKQMKIAQIEVQKPFAKEAELAVKSARLAELDALLNLEAVPESRKPEKEKMKNSSLER